MLQIKVENGTAKVFTPYNTTFVTRIKNIGGRRWNAAEKCWTVPESEIETVRALMMEVYGETDLPDETEKITVRVTFNERAVADQDSVVLFGKTIARATGRDSGAKIGDDAVLESGEIYSGGSQRHWCTVVKEGTVIKVRNISRAALALETEYDVTVAEVEDAGIDRAALIEEKEKLLARLAEIEKLLG